MEGAVHPVGRVTFQQQPSAEIEADLADEINANVEVIKASEGRWLWFMRKDVSKERSLIVGLAIRLAKVLKEAFEQLTLARKDRPLSLSEEQELSRIAKSLENAYKITGNTDKQKQAASDVEQAEFRVKVREQKNKELEALSQRIGEFQTWIQGPRDEAFRNLPIVNWFFWTTGGAQLEIAKMSVQRAEESVRDLLPYPELLKPALIELINAKSELAPFQDPKSKDGLATRREIREHFAELEKMNKILSLQNEIKEKTKLLASKILDRRQTQMVQQQIRELSAELEKVKK